MISTVFLKNMEHEEWMNYKNVHTWIGRHYGKASLCSHKKCQKRIKVFQWSRKKGKPIEKDINNFRQLCRDCHIALDKRGNMKKLEKPKATLVRLYKSQKRMVQKLSKREKVSQAEIIRLSIVKYFLSYD